MYLQTGNIFHTYTVMCSLNIRKPCFQKKVVSSLKLKSIDFDTLKSCIERSALLSHGLTDISQGVDLYNSELSRIRDFHAPWLHVWLLFDQLRHGIMMRSRLRKIEEGSWRGDGELVDCCLTSGGLQSSVALSINCCGHLELDTTRKLLMKINLIRKSFLALSASCFIGHLVCFTRRILLRALSHSFPIRFRLYTRAYFNDVLMTLVML